MTYRIDADAPGISDTEFGNRLNIAADKVGGIVNLARLSSLSRTVIHKYINGISDPSRLRLIALANAANVSVEWLATGKEPTPPSTLPADMQFMHQIAQELATLYHDEKVEIPALDLMQKAITIFTSLYSDWNGVEEGRIGLKAILNNLRLELRAQAKATATTSNAGAERLQVTPSSDDQYLKGGILLIPEENPFDSKNSRNTCLTLYKPPRSTKKSREIPVFIENVCNKYKLNETQKYILFVICGRITNDVRNILTLPSDDIRELSVSTIRMFSEAELNQLIFLAPPQTKTSPGFKYIISKLYTDKSNDEDNGTSNPSVTIKNR